MKSNIFLVVWCLSFLTGTQAPAQVALNGTADYLPYAGLQPELIRGVSALPAIDQPLVRHVYLVDKNILGIIIDERAVILDNQKPYARQDGDTIIMGGYHGYSRILQRNGERIGYICGKDAGWLREFNVSAGEKLDTGPLSMAGNTAVISASDPYFKHPVHPVAIYRKSYPVNRTHTAIDQQLPLRHEFFLVMPSALKNNNLYTLVHSGEGQIPEEISFQFEDTRLRTEAIHHNLLGYAPGDSKKAFLSTWMGDGGDHIYREQIRFRIIESNSCETVFQGTAEEITTSDLNDRNAGSNANMPRTTPMLTLDFSSLETPGTYRIVAEGIGTSWPFKIGTATWENMARLLLKGFLHQRSGIELGPPYTDYQRPRNMHPADHTVINKCDPELFFHPPKEPGGSTQTGVFERIQASIIPGTEVPEAWGGWMDAGDFDQRMTHLWSVRRMILLHEINPGYFSALQLNIPESQNRIPDILDEAAWCLDLYRRTQGVYEKGGVSWWVESVEHPRQGEPSWLNSLPTALVPPTPRASLLYAATAAQISQAIREYDALRSETYLASAREAMQWVETHPDAPDVFGSRSREVYHAMACLNLYIRTGEPGWHEKYLSALGEIFGTNIAGGISRGNYEVFINYLLIRDLPVDAALVIQARKALIQFADDLLQGARQNAFGILKPAAAKFDRMSTLGDMILPVVLAHHITGDEKYVDALVQTVQYTMGANPMNRSYISGLGERWFLPYQLDWETNHVAIPSGIPNFGPAFQTATRWGWWDTWAIGFIEDSGLYPNTLLDWPHAEKCFNGTWMAPLNEFTVRSPMGELLLLSAYLAQRPENNPATWQ